MRDSLQSFFKDVVQFQYSLPHDELKIEKSIFSTDKDICYSSTSNEELSEVIYNALVHYSFNEFRLKDGELDTLHGNALVSKLRYNISSSETTKLKYGFYGEVLLYCFLYAFYGAKPIIARGVFYNPLDDSETKGYDSYHLIQDNETTELWFGEVKFRVDYKSGVKNAIDNLNKAISDKYLETNVHNIFNGERALNMEGTKLEEIFRDWEQNPFINLKEEIQKHNIKLIYPILIISNGENKGYDEAIKEYVSYIKKTFSKEEYGISIPYTLNFIWLPVNNVKEIKKKVIEWIESRKPLM